MGELEGATFGKIMLVSVAWATFMLRNTLQKSGFFNFYYKNLKMCAIIAPRN
jgi:hypothetical protein